ncbi:hypothetical protein AB3S75_034846 [Citrus x aurantiifolia]
MGYLVFRLFRFHPPDSEEIVKLLLNKKKLDPDFYVQTDKKHRAECVVYGFHFRKNCSYYQVIIWFLFQKSCCRKKKNFQ